MKKILTSALLFAGSLAAQVADSDGDTVPDDVDNCPAAWNFLQEESDGDGLGDACDWCVGPGTDTDWDGVCDGDDLCTGLWDPSNQTDCGHGGEGEGEGEGEEVGPLSPNCSDTGHTRYPADRVHSPITCGVLENLQRIAARDISLFGDRFMKVGDSISTGYDNMQCFENGSFELPFSVDVELVDVLADFQGSFGRDSLATEVGQVASWPIVSGSLFAEHSAHRPRFAFIMFGANDIFGADEGQGFADDMELMAEELMALGTIPIIIGQPAAPVDPLIEQRAELFGRISRHVAERLQVPFVNLQVALEGLPNQGLAGDNRHLSVLNFNHVCGLQDGGDLYGTNVRNMVALEALDRVSEALEVGHWDSRGLSPFEAANGL